MEEWKTEEEREKAQKELRYDLEQKNGWERISQEVWDLIVLYEGGTFETMRGLEFTYTVKGNEIFFSRKEKSVTRSTVDMALKKALELGGIVKGPKKLEVFGASYIYPILIRFGIIRAQE